VSDEAAAQQSPAPQKKDEVQPPPSPPQPSNTPPVASGQKTHPRGSPSLIHFAGKRDHKKIESVSPASSHSTSSQQSVKSESKIGIWSPEQMAGYNAAWLGRPTLSIAEIEAIETGGASLTQNF
jgi:hypothetical protein